MMSRLWDVTSREVVVPGNVELGRALDLDGRRGIWAALDVVRLGLGGDRGHHAVLRAE